MTQATDRDEDNSCGLLIEGMTCASCVRRVERALAGVEGVQEARVNLATESAEVHLSSAVAMEDLVRAVEAAGYEASVAVPAADRAEEAVARRARRAADLRRRRTKLAVGAVLSAGVLVLAYGYGAERWSAYLQLALVLPVFVWVGAGFHKRALENLRHGAANMDTLVSLGASVAFFYSLAATVAMPGKATYYDVAGVIVTLISVGKYLEVLTRGRAGEAIEALASLAPSEAHLLARAGSPGLPGDRSVDVAVEALRVGDVVLVRPGEAVPVDGLVTEGWSAVDESMVTGESVAAGKGPGDGVTGGTVNGFGSLKVRVERTGADSTLANIMELVERAQLDKSKAQRLADQVSSVFVPVVLVASAATFAGWLASGRSLIEALIPAVAVLVVACPCALGLATPVAVMVGTGRGAELGLLVSGGEVLERVRRLGVVVVDKTGTLTVGHPEVVDLVVLDGTDGSVVMRMAAAVEAVSEHPLARAVQASAEQASAEQASAEQASAEQASAEQASAEQASAEQASAEQRGVVTGGGRSNLIVTDVQVTPGAGASAYVNGQQVVVGSVDWVTGVRAPGAHGPRSDRQGRPNVPGGADSGARSEPVSQARNKPRGEQSGDPFSEARRVGERLASRSLTPVAVAVDGEPCLVMGIADPLRPDAAAGVARLHSEGLRVVLATGDRSQVAEAAGAQAGVDEVHAGLRPEDKAALVKALRERYGPVAMVGDGINDAPALATADIGIAVGSGTGVAMATAQITLVHGDIGAVADAIALSRATRRIIWQNLGWAFGYNLVLVPLAAVGILPPMVAALAMATSSVSVVTNALRLRRFGRGAQARKAGHQSQPASAPATMPPATMPPATMPPATTQSLPSVPALQAQLPSAPTVGAATSLRATTSRSTQ